MTQSQLNLEHLARQRKMQISKNEANDDANDRKSQKQICCKNVEHKSKKDLSAFNQMDAQIKRAIRD